MVQLRDYTLFTIAKLPGNHKYIGIFSLWIPIPTTLNPIDWIKTTYDNIVLPECDFCANGTMNIYVSIIFLIQYYDHDNGSHISFLFFR